jgi:hypothetical protein
MSFRGFKRRWLRRIGLIPPKYKSFVGPSANYEAIGLSQFDLLRIFGLSQDHYLLDVGCGSLTCGRLAIPFLATGHYFGIEPEQWLIDDGVRYQLGREAVESKRPTFSNDRSFKLSLFGRQFDYLIAHSILSHTSQAESRTLLAEAALAMTEAGIFLASYRPGESDYTGEAWSYPAAVFYTPGRIQAFASQAGLQSTPVTWPHPRQQWVVFYRSSNSGVEERLRAAENRAQSATYGFATK